MGLQSMSDKQILEIAKKHETVFREGFIVWLHSNIHVLRVFAELADRLWERGRRHYSSRTIGEKMRFDHDVSEADGEFKLNNNYTPDLGRTYVLCIPSRVDLFSYRRGGDFGPYVKEAVAEGTL